MSRLLVKLLSASMIVSLLAIPSVQAQDALSLNELLRRVEQGTVKDNQENKAREQRFRADKAAQDKLLKDAVAEKVAEENRSQRLEGKFESNQVEVDALELTYAERLGDLKKLFGVMQQVAGDARGNFDVSLTNIQYPERGEKLSALAKKIGSASQLPSMSEIEGLWFELQREMTESGRVVKFPAQVIKQDGSQETMDVVRVGLYSVVSDGKYLNYEPSTGNLTELPRQPEQSRFTDSAAEMLSATSGSVRFGLDPTLGGVLKSLVARPNLQERVQQGGLVGYLILALGAVGLLISLERIVVLGIASRKVTAQLASDTPNKDNALGRVLSVYDNNKSVDTDTLELKLSEAIFKETPALNRALLFIKIISVIAPLMGLLGTVTGMINTFQAITLYGTGDPKLMAGGISQALVTTVLGLVVAIPMVLLHTLVSGRSKRIVQVLQEQSAGIIATHAEQHPRT